MNIVLSGGLGNQMFQYALYLACKEKRKEVKLDSSLYSYTKIHNGYELEKCFGITETEKKYSKWHLLKLRAALKYKPKSLIYDDLQYFDGRVFKTSCKYIYGYWQSEKYFLQIQNKIRDTFVFKGIDSVNNKIADEIAKHVSISLHIRGGDYLGNNTYANICTEDYYMKAIDLMLSKIILRENVKLYVFTNDIEFSGRFIQKALIPCKVVNINIDENSYKDMYLMSKCKHNIIANSSFSWWGAWLNDNPSKIVIAPKRWFNELSEENYKDIVPETWIKI